MLKLKPYPDTNFVCPECGSIDPLVSDIRFESINVLAECMCTNCGFVFFHILPAGHMVSRNLSIGKVNGKLYYDEECPEWLGKAVLKSHNGNRKNELRIEKTVLKKCDDVIILNTLDSLYGHVLLKLYNAFYHLDHQPELGLIIIIPKIFKWLIPTGCAEVWVVDLKLSELEYSYDYLQKFVAKESSRFNKIYLSPAYSHPDISAIDMERLTGIPPFNLDNFTKRKPTITFILREDRWWFSSLPDYWFYRLCRKVKSLTRGKDLLSLRQNRLVKKTIRIIRKELPELDVYVVGLGKTGTFMGYATDERRSTIDTTVEKEWCNIYSQSHVVIGIHGSNMLLPTAMAAGCVEILPDDRYGNMIQDISVRYTNRLQLYFYRFVDQYARPKSVASKVLSMIRNYDGYRKNMCQNIYQQPTMTALSLVDDADH